MTNLEFPRAEWETLYGQGEVGDSIRLEWVVRNKRIFEMMDNLGDLIF